MPIMIQLFLLPFALAAIPGVFVLRLWRSRECCRYDAVVRVLQSGTYLILTFLVAPWYWLSVYLRYVWFALFIVVALVSYRRVAHCPFFPEHRRRRWLGRPWMALELAAVVGLLLYALSGNRVPDVAVELEFPLRGGMYCVTQGGGNVLLNRHRLSAVQPYAIDIVQLNAGGNRATGIYPRELERYAIFGQMIYSPCDGTVISAVDGVPDNIPPAVDTDRAAGNHVVLACQDVTVVLMHMQRGSVRVAKGEEVRAGQPLGAVGNSGYSTEPHLHMDTIGRTLSGASPGSGVPILFDGRFPVRNTVLVIR